MLTYDRQSGQILRGTKVCGTIRKDGYLVTWYEGRLEFNHRLAFLLQGLTIPDMVDHINGDRSDNRWTNLRLATNTENQYNRKDTSKAGRLRGALYNKRANRWYSMIRHNGKRTYLGMFATEQEAHMAYMRAAQELHKEFAYER